jgi:hypothetical protein
MRCRFEVNWMFVWIAVLLSLLPTTLLADSWLEPHDSAVASPDGSYLLRIDLSPTKVNSDTVRFNTRAIWFQWTNGEQRYHKLHEIPLPQFVAPVRTFVSDDGDVVMIGAWYGNTRGSEVWIYSAAGELVKEWKLTQLYSQNAFMKLPKSTSSIHWIASDPWIDGGRLLVPETLGGRFEFDLKNGKFVYQPAPKRVNPIVPASRVIPWLPYLAGVMLCSYLIGRWVSK